MKTRSILKETGSKSALPPVLATTDANLAPGATNETGSSLLNQSPPAIDPDAAARLAWDIYGITGELELLSSERDANFRIRLATGEQALLKITNDAEPQGVTAMQTAALMHLAKIDPSLPVQRIHATLEGKAWTSVTSATGRQHIVRLMSYLEGKMLHAVTPAPGLHHALGNLLARLTLGLRGFFHPAGGHFLQWDIKQAHHLRPMIESVADQDLRRRLTYVLDHFKAEIAPRIPRLRAQMVHNDFNPHNIVVDAVAANRPTGIIDFGDMLFTPIICDLAIACSYHVQARENGGDGLDLVREIIAGYTKALPLEEEELELLPDLIRLRHITTLAITAWRAQLYPENAAYILRNKAASLRGIDTLENIGMDAAVDALRAAANSSKRN
ncbi:phosphotransferase [Daeguia caeni]|uniref:Hydroxylysine kinase n=1 Tax=Daeguia caeni TaxID=439612 RepID=A0ABV9H0Q1_9HYPH